MVSGAASSGPPLPVDAFVDPHGANRRQIEELGRQVLGVIFDHLTSAAGRLPLPLDPPPAAAEIPDERLPTAEILDRLRDLLAGSMSPSHPGWLGHMDPAPTTFSILGEAVSAALNNNMLSWEMSPALSRLETQLTGRFAGLFGLPDGSSGGILTSGGSLANLHALTVARNAAFDSREAGIAGLGRRPVIVASEAAHTSLVKAAMILGLGTGAVVSVPADAASRLRPGALERALRRVRAEGAVPFCVVATAGTTVTGSIDPLSALADIAAEQGLWFHVDAAYGGALALSPRRRAVLAGIERADSITFNPQKWLYVAKTCAMILYRDLAVVDSAFRVGAPYARAGEGPGNLGEIGVQGTRHAESLKLWLSLLHLGRQGYAALIESSCRLSRRFRRQVAARPFLALAGPSDTNIVCFRGVPEGLSEDLQDRWTADLQAHLQERGFFLSLPRYRGRHWLRAVLLNPHAGDETCGALCAGIDAFHALRHQR